MELLYGRHAVLESLRAGRRKVHRIYLAAGAKQTGSVAEILAAALERGCPAVEAPRQTFDRAGPVNHQGVLAEAGPYPYVDLDQVLPEPEDAEPLYLVLDHLQDVQNVGTLLRTAEAMAVTAIMLPDRRAAEITPAVVNASAGAVEHLRVALAGNLVQALDRLKGAGVWVAGLDACPEAIPLGRADLTGRLALVVGAQGAGLARLVRERCDWLLAIPMYGRVGSLNVAVAGSVALVAARQARIHTRI
jgi:23S rRNA (guanosine2251-2'-O)-methyltransferase